MQPYFFPYGGYYRLMAATDMFVIYDCVQFARRGRVHRSRIPETQSGRPPKWLTLPLAKAPRETRICDLRFAQDAKSRLAQTFKQFGLSSAASTPLRQKVCNLLEKPEGTVVDVLHDSLRLMRDACEFDCDIRRSSSLEIAPDVKGEARVIKIVQSFGGRTYINSPGGVDLYSAATFADAELRLRFLDPYAGAIQNMLQAVFTMKIEDIRNDIVTSIGCSSLR
ncbi:WbqC family protein [Sulfitobacter guttiformis]